MGTTLSLSSKFSLDETKLIMDEAMENQMAFAHSRFKKFDSECKNFERKYKLRALSTMTAQCLSKWEGENLFLGNLTILPPAAARFLAQWKGKWLSLNGLTKLSPDVAKYLSQWQGDVLSLNGLKSLSTAEAGYLSNRHGKELELADLTHISPNAEKHLSNWVKSGGKIYGTDKF